MFYVFNLSFYGVNYFFRSKTVKINVYLLDFVILNAIFKKRDRVLE
tara:strand:- start:37605 stop:37742 length:138 start_codon:yes stop_codon:yes gene_type:complete